MYLPYRSSERINLPKGGFSRLLKYYSKLVVDYCVSYENIVKQEGQTYFVKGFRSNVQSYPHGLPGLGQMAKLHLPI